ncbi:DNA mismatch repair protein MutT [Microbacterium aurum]|uniref:DNA mismatch repair protein MutT n=1 Tax=Microbacterium aurum TaxID=36805 RepID=A0A1P8U4Y9_9MICO|nr:NUDIX domain-containing protein [Microbacterium aurum]APZ33185.1 DNA mismatch repair protein MutT [Microbacterium aurum]MBM7826773.1 putative NUDIX family NTP pyrophosphohydrolase [Microbacterium aurum]
MVTTSAGILLYRTDPDGKVSALVAHMGGPFWARKDEGAWSIPKGEFDPRSESARDAAAREFREELGVDPPDVPYVELGTFAYSSGSKKVTVFCGDGTGFLASDADRAALVFGEFEMEWPPRSGRRQSFPEIDRVAWMPLAEAGPRLVAGQRPALDALEVLLRQE